MPDRSVGTRTIALVGPGGAGKTSLAEALLFAAGAVDRQGSVDAGTSVGDSSPEARQRAGSTELNLMNFEFLGDRFAIVDSPGSVGFSADGALAVAAADLAVVVVDPDTDRAILAEPALRQLQIREGEKVTGFVDLALERAFKYRPGKPSEQIEIPADLAEREKGDRFHMLEQLADHDDALLEQLLLDETPDRATIFADIARETKENLVVPVLFGSASNGFGVRRLMKALRHDAPAPEAAAERLGAKGGCAFVFKVSHGGNMGRLALARGFGGPPPG